MCKGCECKLLERIDALEYEYWLSEEQAKVGDPLPENENEGE